MPVPARRRTLLALGLWVCAAPGLFAQPPVLPEPQPVPFAADRVEVLPPFPAPAGFVEKYTLGEALKIAHARHPYLAASRASINIALMKPRGLDEAKRRTSIASGILMPDYDVRMQQADLGLKAATIEFAQWEHEVTYAVVRCYYTVVYSRMQQRVSRDLVRRLQADLEQVRQIVASKGGAVKGGVTKNDEDSLKVFIGEAQQRLIQAEEGELRGRELLREAMGLDPMCRVDVVDEVLPEIKPPPILLDTVKAHAITRRGEVLLTQIGADVTRLEACAQWARKFSLMAYTYANATDIHARPIPAGERYPDYKPAAMGPDMPDRLIGKADTRAAIAQQYAAKNAEVARHTQSLIAVEAGNAWGRFVEATRKVAAAREAAAPARQMVDRRRAAAGGAMSKEDVITSELLSTRAFATLNEAMYEQVVALADLERITAGGVRPDFPGRDGP